MTSLTSVLSLVAALAMAVPAAAAIPLKPHYPGHKTPNCLPSRRVDMHYVGDGDDHHSYVNVSLSTTHPAIMLEQLAAVSSVDCDDYSVAVTFNSSQAFAAAAGHWSIDAANPADSLLFITNHLGDCDAELERGFFVASAVAVHNESMTIVASTTKTPMNETASDIDIDFHGVPQSAPDVVVGSANATGTIMSRATRTKRKTITPSLAIDHIFSLSPMVLAKEDPVTISIDKATVSASASISGRISYSFLKLKLKQFTIDYDASVDAQLGIDVVLAGALFKDEPKLPFPAFEFAAFEVPGILTLGPALSFGVGVGLAVDGAVALNAQLGASIPQGSVHIDVQDQSQSTSSGWTPQLTHSLTLTESVTARIDPFIDINLGVGCKVLDGLLDLSVGLDAQPRFNNAFTLKATQVISNGTLATRAGAGADNHHHRRRHHAVGPRHHSHSHNHNHNHIAARADSCPNGVEVKSDFVFSLTAVVTKFFTKPLYSVTVPIADKCIK